MWITGDVELPEEVLEAHSAGRLVFFVGAGASVDAPSGLPLFGQLAQQIAELACLSVNTDISIDKFLGGLPRDFDTHRHVCELIDRDDSEPNSTHDAIVGIASSAERIKIVTTNFDDHLFSSATASGLANVERWIGPALPLGDDFAGIVHLHGSVRRDSKQLIITDSDFGKAYLTHAWAPRFLLPLFENNVVLFIGYGHEDPIMQYLALGLPSGSSRFTFARSEAADREHWKRLGIGTIDYPVQGDDHSALVAALKAWDVWARMGRSDHRARMREIILGGTALSPVESDYLVDRLRSEDGALEFAQATNLEDNDRKLAWLRWLEGVVEFKAMFAGEDIAPASNILANWFCESFIDSPKLHGAALQTVERLGQTFSSGLLRWAEAAAGRLVKEDEVAGKRWKAFLATSVHGHSSPPDMRLLLPYYPTEQAESYAVLRATLRPYLELKKRLSWEGPEDFRAVPYSEVRWPAETESLYKHVAKLVESNQPADSSVEILLSGSLIAAYELLEAFEGEEHWDSLTSGRSAIEPHPQDSYVSSHDAIIDGLRAYGERSLPVWPELPERWWALERTLFRRLSLHLVAVDVNRSSDEKITWILDRTALYEFEVQHELFQVLRAAAAGASESVRALLLEEVLAGQKESGESSEEEEDLAYPIFNLLHWLVESAPDWIEAGAAFNSLRDANPSFARREHPDFNSWFSSESGSRRPMMEPEELIQALERDAGATLEDLLKGDYPDWGVNEPDWRSVLSLLGNVAKSRPDLGVKLWDELDGVETEDGRIGDVAKAIVNGWSDGDLGAGSEPVVDRVGTVVNDPALTSSIGRFLLGQIRMSVDSEDTIALENMHCVATNLWDLHSASFTHDYDDPVGRVSLFLNSWPGELAQYWVTEIDRRWRNERDGWSGLNEEERRALTALLEGPPATQDAVQPALASQLSFIFAADPEFAAERILPLFRRDDTAYLSWNSYLHHPRYNNKMLDAGLLDSLVAQWCRLHALRDEVIRRNFFSLVASVLSFADISEQARADLLSRSVIADQGAYRVEFAESVVRFLQDDGVNGFEVWERWLRGHVKNRLGGRPREAAGEEISCWADAVPYLGKKIPEAVEMFRGRDICLRDKFIGIKFSQTDVGTYVPDLMSHYVERIRNSSPRDGFLNYEVNQLIVDFIGVFGREAVSPVVDAAREAGFSLGEKASVA